jgi:hypothetical protein
MRRSRSARTSDQADAALWPMVWLVAIAVGVVLLALPSLLPRPMGSVVVVTGLNGQPVSAAVLVFNSSAKQIMQVHSDQSGVVAIKQLPKGKYTLKFQGVQGSPYPAVETIEVVGKQQTVVKVELGQAASAATATASTPTTKAGR